MSKSLESSPLRTLVDNMNSKDSTQPLVDHKGSLDNPNSDKGVGTTNKKMSVERIYQKKTQLEHILLRPDTYIGSVEPVTQGMWVYDGEEVGMIFREITFVPGLYKIFDEILVNAADNKQRDKNMDCIKVDIDPENNVITIYNNGKGIPVVEHKVEKMFVPSLIFGHLLTSSNYNDDEKKVTGGRNGYGAKLCNIFSTKFIVETANKESRSAFKQAWTNNMGKTTEAKVKPFLAGEDYTRVTFSPDLSKFKMNTLDKDIVALMSRRAFDIAGTSRGVKVFLNGKRLPIKNFKDYVDLYIKGKEDEQGNQLKLCYDNPNPRWEIAVTLSDHGFQQVSFVNSIATTKGGRHVDYVTDQVVSKLIDTVKKKNKGGVKIKPFQIKNHLWVFVNCLIENPTFDSQTKENMTLQAKSFGSKCPLADKFIAMVQKCGVVESILSWMKFKQQTQLNMKCSKTKHSKLKGIPKLEDANNAGTKNSVDCTLILTEGDSAKTLAVSGLGVVGRDNYGVFPLRGKMLNVREATHKQILENAEINNIIKIMGLQYKKKYETVDDLKSLRYGKLMIMTDQDQDGSHIKGLLINFIHHNWPSLLKLPFLEEFITPIVKVTKGKEERSFYSLPEFEEWKQATDNWHTWKIKYYKGLGTSTAKEAKEYFADMARHRIRFRYTGPEDDNAIQLAFSKKMVDQRKEWLTNGMEERKRRKELGLPELYLYGKETKAVTYQEFVNKELILFSNMDNERSIPSIVDGLKPGSRKVIFTCLKRNDKREVKVAQLAGSVAEHSAYHHGEQSLMATIINLAQNFVGSNNINLLLPIGQFGTRLQGGKDAASPRYIFTKLSPLTRHIFNMNDDALLNYINEDNQRIEPDYYVPIIPMVLVNGSDGIGTGWMTKIPNYNPREIVNNLRRMIRGEEPLEMMPWFKNFKGSIEKLDHQRFVVNGEISILTEKSIEIVELPVRIWTQSYKESTLEPMLHGSEKIPPSINDYKEYHTDTTVRFTVSMAEEKLMRAEQEGLHKMFKLQTTMATTSMVLFDHNGCLKKYESVDEILKEFFTLRLEYYHKRKAYIQGMLGAEASKLSNQARFILEKIDGKIFIENRKKKDIVDQLIKRGFDSDPVKTWKEQQNKERALEEAAEEIASDSDAEDVPVTTGPDFAYLLEMRISSLSMEEKDKLLKKRDEKLQELENIKKKSPADLWTDDLDSFMVELDAVEQKEREDEASGSATSKNAKMAKLGAGGGRMRQKKFALEETKPSPHGQRVAPRIDPELRKKFEKASIAASKRPKKKEDLLNSKSESKDDESDMEPKSLADRIGNSPEILEKKKKAIRQTKLSFPKKEKGTPKKPKRNPWSDSDVSDSDEEIKEVLAAIPRDTNPRRKTASKANYRFDSSDSDFDVMNDEEKDESMNQKSEDSVKNDSGSSSEGEETPATNNKKAVTNKAPSKPAADDSEHEDDKEGEDHISLSDSDSGSSKATKEKASKKKLAAPKKPATDKKEKQKSAFDSLVGDGTKSASESQKPSKVDDEEDEKSEEKSEGSDIDLDDEPPKKVSKKRGRKKASSDVSDDEFMPKPKKSTAAARKPVSRKKKPATAPASDDSDEDMFSEAKSKKVKKQTKPRRKKGGSSDDDGELGMGDVAPRARSARSRAPVKYNFGDDSDVDEF